MSRNKRPKESQKFNAELEDSRKVLRQDRRRTAPATAQDAKREEDRIREYQQDLMQTEERLEQLPSPDRKEVELFEEGLKLRNREIRAFENKLHELSDDREFLHLIESFEDILRSQEELLKSFEKLLKAFDPFPPEFLESFAELLDTLGGLLTSFSGLVSKFDPPPLELIESLEDLLKSDEHEYGFEDLLESFENLLKDFDELPPALVRKFERLLLPLEGLLFGFDVLLLSLEEQPPPTYLLTSVEKLLRGYQELLKSLEDLLTESFPPQIELVEAFEDPLRILAVF